MQVSLSDQLYRQAKIDEENRRLKKKSKVDGTLSKKGKKSSKKSDAVAADDNDDDIYPTIKVTRGGELPEGATASGNEDNDDDNNMKVGNKNKKYDPHRALNIDLNEVPKKISSPPHPKQASQKPVDVPSPPPPESQEKPKKLKKKTTAEKEAKATNSKTKLKKPERSDYKELVSPIDDVETSVPPPPPPPPASSTIPNEKPKKKKTKEKRSTSNTVAAEANQPASLLFDIMSDEIPSSNQSTQQQNEQDLYKLAGQSDNLTVVSHLLSLRTSFATKRTFMLLGILNRLENICS